MHGEDALGLQTAPGAVVAEHGPDEFQAGGDRYEGTVVEPGEAGWEEPGQAVAVDRWFQAEVGEAADLRLADGQLVHTGLFGEAGDGLQIGGFDRSVVTGRGLGTGVVAVLIAVGRVVLGDLVDVGQHVTAHRRPKPPLLRSGGVHGPERTVSPRFATWAGQEDVDVVVPQRGKAFHVLLRSPATFLRDSWRAVSIRACAVRVGGDSQPRHREPAGRTPGRSQGESP
ncbi:hypothetical protein ABZ865_35235 [Streptomyces sp. NPDC047085]|uniref:hypothetical protein n=1 Tax=Streptomyces sp. NPDC047085 TaxID=3155140 RepID=UPI0033E9D5BA